MTLLQQANASNSPYVLATGAEASKRLDLQDKILFKNSYKYLEKAGLTEGKVVWDIGCGSGVMTKYLAEKVGKKGHVYAVDISKQQLKIARERIKASDIDNVTFINSDINSLNKYAANKADIVYMRFLLMHIPEPQQAINIVKDLLKPSGVVVSEEPINNTVYFSDNNPVIEEYIKVYVDLGKYNGNDFNIGSRLESLFKNAGFKNVKADYIQQQITIAEAKKLLLMGLSEWGSKAVKANLVTDHQIKDWKKTITKMKESDPSLYLALPQQAYIVAYQ